MPHFRLPALDHEVVSLIWAIVLGAFIYFGCLSVGVHGGTAFIAAALGSQNKRYNILSAAAPGACAVLLCHRST